ncbi:MAG: YncE family protein [Kineosporiaceae bacterium]
MSRRGTRVRRLSGRHARRPRRGIAGAALPLSLCLLAVMGLLTAATASFLRHPQRVIAQTPPDTDALARLGTDVAAANPPRASASPTSSSPSPSATVITASRAAIPSDQRRAVKQRSVETDGSPKALAVAPDGSVAVLSMTSREILVVGPDGSRRASVPTTVTPSRLGEPRWSQAVKGAPVDGAFTPDGGHLWVSNYAMSGPGFTRPGTDECRSGSGLDGSFLYRVSTRTWTVDAVVAVGAVPKDVRVSPDGASVLVTTWCSGELTVVDAATAEVRGSLPLGSHPRGIAVSPDSRTAYVTLTGGRDVVVVDLAGVAEWKGVRGRWSGLGEGPRQVVLTRDGRRAYVTCLGAGTVLTVDVATGRVLATARPGREPRTAVLSGDGSALFVVNYESSTITRLRASDLEVVETVATQRHTIALGYAAAASQLWVGQVDGTLDVYGDEVRR